MSPVSRIATLRLLALGLVATGLAACQDNSQLASGRAWRPISSEMMALMTSKGVDSHAPILIRTFKKEAEFEIWKMKPDGKYVHLKTFPMCRWSGQLGPKVREGDRQVPEGFYTITPGQMNPNSAYYLSFNVGYPNALDRALGHSGGSIMVHGACSSAGCFSMTDQQIADIYSIAREAFGGGQRAIQMESLPFHMTPENLAKHRLDPHIAFWKNLKEGSDAFEVTQTEPSVGTCGRKYVFNATASGPMDAGSPCPAFKQDETTRELVSQKRLRDETQVAELVAKGVRPVRVVYADGGQNPEFANRTGDVSRPDALAAGATEIALDEPKAKSPVVKIAAAKAARDAGKLKTDKAGDESVVARTDPTPTASTTAFAAVAPPSSVSALSSWLGLKKEEQKPVEATEPAAAPQSAAVPLPPRRGAAKPQASLDPKGDAKVFLGAKDPKASDFVALEPVRK